MESYTFCSSISSRFWTCSLMSATGAWWFSFNALAASISSTFLSTSCSIDALVTAEVPPTLPCDDLSVPMRPESRFAAVPSPFTIPGLLLSEYTANCFRGLPFFCSGAVAGRAFGI
jgi:hypothetical protein